MKRLALTLAIFQCVLLGDQSELTFINKQIDQLIRLHSNRLAVSDPEGRKVIFGNFFSPESHDAIAFFIIEDFGGSGYNDWAEYLAFFHGNDLDQPPNIQQTPFRLVCSMKVGGKLWRGFEWETVKIRPGTLSVSGKFWQPGKDPGCCPTGVFSTTFREYKGSIVESN